MLFLARDTIICRLQAQCKHYHTADPGPTVNFNNYLVVGDDYSGGFSDNSLTVRGQLNSYPQRIFEQLATMTDPRGAKGPFIQPYINSDNGYPGPKKILGYRTYVCPPYDSMLAPINYPNFLMDPRGPYALPERY